MWDCSSVSGQRISTVHVSGERFEMLLTPYGPELVLPDLVVASSAPRPASAKQAGGIGEFHAQLVAPSGGRRRLPCRPQRSRWASEQDLGEAVLDAAGELRAVGNGRDVGGDGDAGPLRRGDQ